MKKLFFVLTILFLSIGLFAQDTTSVNPSATQSLLSWLASQWHEHMWTILALVFAVVSEWLGNTDKAKEGSIIAWILNMIGKFLKKKTDVVQTKKAKFMNEGQFKLARGLKIIVALILLAGISYQASGQSLFKPITRNDMLYSHKENKLAVTQTTDLNKFFFRVSTGVIANQFTYQAGEKKFTQSVFSKIGIGGTMAHYTLVNDQPFNDYSFNAFVFFPTEQPLSGISFAGTVSAINVLNLGKLNVGAGYDFGQRKVFALTAVSYTF